MGQLSGVHVAFGAGVEPTGQTEPPTTGGTTKHTPVVLLQHGTGCGQVVEPQVWDGGTDGIMPVGH